MEPVAKVLVLHLCRKLCRSLSRKMPDPTKVATKAADKVFSSDDFAKALVKLGSGRGRKRINRSRPRARFGCGALGKYFQPERFEEGHADDVLVAVAHLDVLEENPLEFEPESAVEIEIVDVDVARVDVNLVQIADHERVVDKAEGGPFANTLALGPRLTDKMRCRACSNSSMSGRLR